MAVTSPELTLEELKDVVFMGLRNVYRPRAVELMESEHCLVGGLFGKGEPGKGEMLCSSPCSSGNFTLVDEKIFEFPLLMDYQCRMHLLNVQSLYACSNMFPKLLESGVLSLRIGIIRMENIEEIRKVTWHTGMRLIPILRLEMWGKKACEIREKVFTAGHYFRGVQ